MERVGFEESTFPPLPVRGEKIRCFPVESLHLHNNTSSELL